MKFKTLWKGKYASVISPIDHPYEALGEPNVILTLPVIYVRNNPRFIIRKEFCPPYFVRDTEDEPRLFYTVISGKVEPKESPDSTTLREIKEEAGLIVENHETLYKRFVPICKSSVMWGQISILKLNKYKSINPPNDGTEYETKSKTVVVGLEKLESIISSADNVDFLLISMYHIFKSL
jgi:hypothetical protein